MLEGRSYIASPVFCELLCSLVDAAEPPGVEDALLGGAVALNACNVANNSPGAIGLPDAMLLLTVDAVSFNMVALYVP